MTNPEIISGIPQTAVLHSGLARRASRHWTATSVLLELAPFEMNDERVLRNGWISFGGSGWDSALRTMLINKREIKIL